MAALLPRVRAWVADLGAVPSRNRIMAEFKVGAPKARAILAALTDENPTPPPPRALHAVPEPTSEPDPEVETEPAAEETEAQVTPAADPVPNPEPVRVWPVVLLALPAFVAIWGGWVGLGRLTGFGPIQLLPGIWDDLSFNSAITLPIGVEAYAAFALRVWLSGSTRSGRAREFAKWSAFASLGLGMAGQIAYHLMAAAAVTIAPWPITTLVSCLPVVVLGSGAALAHLLANTSDAEVTA
ncbi:ABC transporter permease [Amycolatopsis cynarae]|uniref:ABC transporter permease n=1 Tax=Amycolatopsis cynarae TaxID=2995223 RepID=A0ABY7B0Y2_9PSEU|nr:ABC transporter permease [Amycolatopsis sp. HUAS 11-8]WAL65950.1 ABC transporter permease [Amycolatopsis sp. HUAS 11-8]